MSLLLFWSGQTEDEVPAAPSTGLVREARTTGTGHADLLKRLLPPVSYNLSGENLSAELAAEGQALDATINVTNVVLAAMFPNLGPMLEDWERVYGTPNACQAKLNPTRQQRLGIVKAKINAGGTFTKEKAIAIAADIGFNITIVEYSDRKFGSQFGTPYGTKQAFIWDVITTGNNIQRRQFGSHFGEAYQSWGNELLECTLRPLAMAGTLLRFIYL